MMLTTILKTFLDLAVIKSPFFSGISPVFFVGSFYPSIDFNIFSLCCQALFAHGAKRADLAFRRARTADLASEKHESVAKIALLFGFCDIAQDLFDL